MDKKKEETARKKSWNNGTPRLGQDPELSLDTPEEEMNSEQNRL